MDSSISPEFLAECIAPSKESQAMPANSLSEPSSLALGDTVTDEPGSPQRTTASFRFPVSDLEAKHYYYGLHSKPVLVARSGTDTWEPPTGPEAYLPCKELRPVSNHPLKAVWEDNLALQILNILESKGVKWTSMDIVRIGFAGEPVAAVVIWIGVMPDTLSGEDGLAVVKECKQVLVASEILDVEVEIRESVVTRYLGPKFRKPVRFFDPAAELVQPLTSTLDLPICNASTPWAEGTGGFYVTGDDSTLYLVTARHGNITGLTVGRANDISSYVRNYYDNGDTQTSKEWAIFSYDNKSGPFSDKGDSRSGIVDGLGRLGGLLTGGDGVTESSDVTYATPMSFILDSLEADGYKDTVEATPSA